MERVTSNCYLLFTVLIVSGPSLQALGTSLPFAMDDPKCIQPSQEEINQIMFAKLQTPVNLDHVPSDVHCPSTFTIARCRLNNSCYNRCADIQPQDNLIIDNCYSGTSGGPGVFDIKEEGMCKWKLKVYWDKLRYPEKLVSAVEKDFSECEDPRRGERGLCRRLTHLVPALRITNPTRFDELCHFSLEYERLVVGYTCAERPVH